MTNETDNSEIAKAQCERTAREYYAFRKRGGTANDLVEIPAMKKLIGNISGKKVIDCGCGFGSYAIYCARQGGIVTAVDISKRMIQFARQEAVEAAAQIDFRVQDVTGLDNISSNTFDIAISSVAVCFNMPQFFREIARVLKPKGVLCFSEVHPMVGKQDGNYFKGGIRKAKNVFGKINPSDPDYEWQWEHYTLENYFTALREAGFWIEMFLEPKPEPATRGLNPELYALANKWPMFFLIRAVKMRVITPIGGQ